MPVPVLSLSTGLRSIRHRRIPGQRTGLPAQAHLVCRLPAGGQQGIAVVRTRSETRGNRQYFREERLQTGTGRAQKDIVHRRSEGLYQNLYRRCSQAHPITYEYEVHGRAAFPPPALYVYTALSLSKRTKYASSTAAASYSIRPTSPSAIATNKLSKLSLTNEVERICS